jgi:hypothetical protein
MNQFFMPPRCSRCLAEEPENSWTIRAETREPSEGNMTLVTYYAVDVPLCGVCHRKLTTIYWLFWVVAVMAGIVSGGLVANYAPQFIDRLDQAPLGAQIAMLFGIGAIISWCVAYVLHMGLIDLQVGCYSPLTNRINFGNKQYQQLFDQGNRYMPKSRTSPRLGI